MKRIVATLSTLFALGTALPAMADGPHGPHAMAPQFSMSARRFQLDADIVAQRAHHLLATVRAPAGRAFRTALSTAELRALRQLDQAAAQLAAQRGNAPQRRLRAEVAKVNAAFQVAQRFVAWRAMRNPLVQADVSEIAARLSHLNAAFLPVAVVAPVTPATVTYVPQAQPTVTYAPQPTVTYAPYPQPSVAYAPPAQPTTVYSNGASVSWYQAR